MIYFIQQGDDGPIKIGYSKSPDDRRASLQCGHSENLGLIAAMEGDREAEAALHVRFAEHRLRGEWFSPAPELVEYAALLRQIDWLEHDLRIARSHSNCKCPVCA